ncbi:MAG: A/G-specific adenine glycosylase [Fimbriimonadaceae bacterium]|nr:A/G-specific adenine glycosylase [Fimbriimonadaceae bacterium]
MTDFQSALLNWYKANARDLPWRKADHIDPYAVWMSEVMLQQTTVGAVIPYYLRWMERFPTLESLAQASEEEVLVYWQGLGYYSRCRNLLTAVKMVQTQGWPQSVQEWLALPGVGDYTAGAVASIAQGIPAALVDGNVERVFARLTCNPKINSALKADAWRWAKENLYELDPGTWNQTLMELGATICTPKNPRCGVCPVSSHCRAFQNGVVADYPSPKPAKEWIEVFHQAWVFENAGKFGLVQAQPGEWWAGMWHSPRGAESDLVECFGNPERERVGTIKHVVTKHKITVEVYRVKSNHPALRWFNRNELDELAISSPGRKILTLVNPAAQPRLELE